MSSRQTRQSDGALGDMARTLRVLALAWVAFTWATLFGSGIYVNYANGRPFLVAVDVVLLLFPALLALWYLRNN